MLWTPPYTPTLQPIEEFWGGGKVIEGGVELEVVNGDGDDTGRAAAKPDSPAKAAQSRGKRRGRGKR